MIREAMLSPDWPKMPLSEVADFLDHMRRPVKASDRVEGDYPYYGANGQQSTINDYIFDEPLILVAEDGGHFGVPGRSIAYTISGKTWVNNHAHILRPKEGVDFSYLFRHLQFYDITRFITGTTRGKLTKTDASRITVTLPPIDEQRRIATMLDKADAIRRKREQALALADDFLRSAFLEMFGDPMSNPKGWKTSSLTDLLNFKTGKLDSNAAREDGKYPFFTCAKEDFWIDQYAFDCEALLLAGNNANADYSVKHYKGKFNAYQRTYVITPKQEGSSFRFFKHALHFQLNQLKRFSKGTNTKYLTMGIFRELMIPSPPLDQQQRFEHICERAEKHIDALELGKRQTDTMFASLSQRAFRGEL